MLRFGADMGEGVEECGEKGQCAGQVHYLADELQWSWHKESPPAEAWPEGFKVQVSFAIMSESTP